MGRKRTRLKGAHNDSLDDGAKEPKVDGARPRQALPAPGARQRLHLRATQRDAALSEQLRC